MKTTVIIAGQFEGNTDIKSLKYEVVKRWIFWQNPFNGLKPSFDNLLILCGPGEKN